jgi:hypothetical protein
MPVDRRLRTELAHVLAAHLRDRTPAAELLGRVKQVHDELQAPPGGMVDYAALEIADEVIVPLECGMGIRHLDTRRAWEAQRRSVAFLLSDLPLTASPRRNRSAGAPEPPRRLARILLLTMLVSLGAWPWVAGYAFVVCWIISPAVWLLMTSARNGRAKRAWPFESESQWLSHEPLLAKIDLPTSWEASPHYGRAMSRSWRSATSAITTALLLFVIYLFTASIWPLSIIVMSFMRNADPRDRDHAATTPQHPHVAH